MCVSVGEAPGQGALAVVKWLLCTGVPAQGSLWHGEGILWEPQRAWADTPPTAGPWAGAGWLPY